MIKCPKCGAMNSEIFTNCMDCHARLNAVSQEKVEAALSPSSAKKGMHWIIALIIMLAVRIVGGLVLQYFVGINTKSTTLAFLFTAELALSYIAIFIWYKLTVRRYIGAFLWALYIYFWSIMTPLFISSNYQFFIMDSYLMRSDSVQYYTIVSILCAITSALLFASFRKRNMYLIKIKESMHKGNKTSVSKNELSLFLSLVLLITIKFAGELAIWLLQRRYYYSGLFISFLNYFILAVWFTALTIWVKLTIRRFFTKKSWILFTYLWILLSPFLSLLNVLYPYIYSYAIFDLHFINMIEYSALNPFNLMFVGYATLGLTIYRKNHAARET